MSQSPKYLIIIPAYNEEKYIGNCLESLLNQRLEPSTVVVVDDSSTDKTASIVHGYQKNYSNLKYVYKSSDPGHQPGSKIIEAFKKALEVFDIKEYDFICKFDADLEFPKLYLERVNQTFKRNVKLGLCGGVCTVFKQHNWTSESLTNLDHVRGALKAYRREAFISISGLHSQMGWDTADEFKLRYRNWEVKVDPSLEVKHYKPTAKAYKDHFFSKQGEVFYALRYGYILATLAAIKIAFRRNQISKFILVLKAFKNAKKKNINFLLSKEEGKFLREYRWKKIKQKLIP